MKVFSVSQKRLGNYGVVLLKKKPKEVINKEQNKSKIKPKALTSNGVKLIGHTRYFECPKCGHTLNEKELMTPSVLTIEHIDVETGKSFIEKITNLFKPKLVEETLWRICSQCNKEVVYKEIDENEKNKKIKKGELKMTDENNVVNLGNTGQVEMEAIEVDQYIGKEVPIETVTEHKGEYGYYVKVQTGVVDTLKSGKELRASRIFGLMTGRDGKIGWTSNSKLGLYLRKMGVAHYKDLKGKIVKIQTSQGKDGNTYMTF